MWRHSFLLPFVLLFHSVHCLTLTSSFGNDLSLEVSQLQKEVSDLRREFQTQETKYSALLSTVISRISSSTHALGALKAEVDSLKLDHLETKDELKNTTDDVIVLKGIMFQNEMSIHSLQQNVTECVTSLFNATEMTKLEVGVMKANVSTLSREYGQTVDRLSSAESKISSLQSNITNEIEMVHSVNSTLTRLRSLGVSTSAKRNDTIVIFEADSRPGSAVQSSKPLQFTHVSLNQGNAFNPGTGIFQAQIPGIYMFWVNLGWRSQTNAKTYIYTPMFSLYSHDEPQPVYETDSKRFVAMTRGQLTNSVSTAVLLTKGQSVWVGVTGVIDTLTRGSFGGVLIKPLP